MRGIDVLDRGQDVDGLIRDLTCWRGTGDCEDVGIGFRLLVGDFRHDCGVCGRVLRYYVKIKRSLGAIVKVW